MPHPLTRRWPLAAATVCALVVGVATGSLAAPAQQTEDPLSPRTTFVMRPDGSSGATAGGAAIPNMDSVKATIRTYYDATHGIADKRSSPYITEMEQLRDTWVPRLAARCGAQEALGHRPAVVFDTDDTTLWTYDMQDAAMHFEFDPALQDEWVQGERFAPVPGMRRVVRAARIAGCKVVGITGRSADQREATLVNLQEHYGSAFSNRWFFTRWAHGKRPSYVSCQAACTRVEFKSQVRAHVERRFGVKIIANFGDQFSDLLGGHGTPVKLPNPTYYLP